MKSKTIIISNQENSQACSCRGILTLFYDDELLHCRLRLYGIEKLSKFCKIGIYHNKQVYSANLLEKNGAYESSLVGDFDIDNDFYTAIIDTNNNNEVILSGGTYAGFYFNDYSVFNENVEPCVTSPKQEDCSDDCDKCNNCKYKEFFYNSNNSVDTFTQTETDSSINEIVNEEKKEAKSETILASIIPQFNYIFENYTADEELNSLIPNGKFVKINENQQTYSIGALYEEDEIKYICYAIKCNYNTPAPEELGEHYQWLPIEKEDPLSEGFYIVFQDAKDLKIIKL